MFRVLSLVLIAFTLISCSKSAPTCSSDEAKNLVVEIVKKRPFVVGFKTTMTKLDISLEAIRTQRYDKDTGQYYCAADLKIAGMSAISKSEIVKKIPIVYTSELTDKEGEFYITVEGI